jgi:beta-lactamase class A
MSYEKAGFKLLRSSLLSVLAFACTAAAQEDNRALLRGKLIAEIEHVAKGLDGVMGIAIKDLTSNEEILVNDKLTFPTASAIKVPVLIELHRQAAAGKFSLTDQRKIERKDEVPSPVLQYFGDGTSSLSLHDLAVLMIRHSDNIATNNLIDQVGMANVNRTLDELGLGQVRLRRKMIDQKASARGEENIATPREAMRLMEMIYRNQVINETLCRDVLAILRLPKRTPITAALPRGVDVASKTGSIEGVQNEWGIVYVPSRPFAIAVMTNYIGEGAPEAVGKVSRLSYDYFARRARSTGYGARVPAGLLESKP